MATNETLIMVLETYRAKNGTWQTWARIEVIETQQTINENAWETDSMTDGLMSAGTWFLSERVKRRAFMGLPPINEDSGWRQIKLPGVDDRNN